MLRMLQYVFDNGTGHVPTLSLFGRSAIRMMATVLKPLGEGLTMLPAGGGYEAQTAGPGFVLARHVPLPNEPRAATVVALEKLEDINARLIAALSTGDVPQTLVAARESLGRMVSAFDEARGG
jgi:hypothetical protein